MSPTLALLAALAAASVSSTAPAADEHGPKSRLDPAAIGKAAGVEATTTPGGVVRIGWPRKDVKVTVGGMPLKPFAGLGSWAAFTATDHGAMVMGDTVFAAGLEVSALHNHFFFDEPKVYFMHVGGEGAPEGLAAGVKAVWDVIKEVRKKNPQPATRFEGPTPQPVR